MNIRRYNHLMTHYTAKLSDRELCEGWHHCLEFDGLLVGPGMGELDCGCHCLPPWHPVYKTIPLGPAPPLEIPPELATVG